MNNKNEMNEKELANVSGGGTVAWKHGKVIRLTLSESEAAFLKERGYRVRKGDNLRCTPMLPEGDLNKAWELLTKAGYIIKKY